MVYSVKIPCKKTVFFNLICRMWTSFAVQECTPATFCCPVVVGTIFGSNMNQFVIRNIKIYRKEHQKNSRKWRERALSHTSSFLAALRCHGASFKSAFSRSCCLKPTCFCPFCQNFIYVVIAVLTAMQGFCNLQGFRDHDWETCWGVSTLTSFFSSISFITKRDLLTCNKYFHTRSPPTHL